MGYVTIKFDAIQLKILDSGDLLAVTLVTQEGETVSLGYLPPETVVRVADTLRELQARVEEEGHPRAEQIAREFHEAYEDLAPNFGYRTRSESAVPWDEVPSANRELMQATVIRLLNRGVIR